MGSTPTAGQIAIEAGTEDSKVTGSGAITFGASKIPANGAAIVATYTPSFAGADFVLNTDFTVDAPLGRIRMINTGSDTSPLRLAADANQQPLLAAYDHNQKSGWNFNPFTQGGLAFDGVGKLKHLTDVGSNIVWDMPSCTVSITDDALTFGAEDFVTGALQITINDAGGSTRFGQIFLASEPQANA